MIQVHLTGDEALLRKLDQLGISAQDVLEVAVTAAATVVREAAEPAAPGPHIATATTEKRPKRVEVSVGPDAEHWYYRFAETGAAPHTIRGNPRLAFDAGGRLVITPVVQHPGHPARPFLRPALDSNEAAAQRTMGDHWKGAVESV